MRARLGTLVAFVMSATPSHALAEGAPLWVPVIVDQPGDEAETLEVVRLIDSALSAYNVELLDPEYAARQFEQVHSFEPEEVDSDRMRHVKDGLAAAFEDAGAVDWQGAAEHLLFLQNFNRAELDFLNGRLHLSKELQEHCLMGVQHMLNAGRDRAAEEEARRCAHVAPQREPDPANIETAALEVYRRVKEELLERGKASLHIELRGAVSAAAQAGCTARLNGVPQGPLPFEADGLLPVAVRVRVDCGNRRGRIHVVALEPGDNEIFIERIDRSVRTGEGFLGLRYDDAKQEERWQVGDALELASLLKATDLLLVRRTEEGRVYMNRIDVGVSKAVAEVSLELNAAGDSQIRAAAQALAAGRSGEVGPLIAGAPRPDRSSDSRLLFAGVALSAGAVASYAASWVLYVQLADFRREIGEAGQRCLQDDSCDRTFARFEDLRLFSPVYGGLGAGLGAAAVVTLLPPEDGVPAWSWVVGCVGTAGAAVGAVLWAGAEQCELGRCGGEGIDPSLGQLVVLQSIPVLAVPVPHGLRALFETEQITATVHYAPGSASAGGVVMRGRF